MMGSNISTDKNERWLLQDKYGGKITSGFWDDVRRLREGEPVDYVIGWAPFLGCHIDLACRPLIPRSETEFWVKNAITYLETRYNGRVFRFLDIFAGSGAIGIAVLKHIARVKADFAEMDPLLSPQIRKNLALNFIKLSRAGVLESDMFDNIRDKYDVILANPPYIPAGRVLEPSVVQYEPHGALFGGEDGLFYIRKLLQKAPAFLRAGGSLWLEFDSPQKAEIEDIVKAGDWSSSEFFKDQYGNWRYCALDVKL